MSSLAWIALALAGSSLALVAANLALLRVPPRAASTRFVSVLIPARNEEANIGAAIESVLLSRGARLELLVLDDSSSDRTREIVADWAARDARVGLIEGTPPDPTRWGKPQACAALADRAAGEILLFMDADVRLEPDAVARIAAALERSEASLLSGVPAQVTEGLVERLVVPLIHFVLLAFLPIALMRRSRREGFGVACGQLLAVERDAYRAAGGHRAVAANIHDGMALARSVRRLGLMTDLADFTPLARCRMYRSARTVIAGFAKNAHEGLGSVRGIVPWSVLLLGGQCAWLVLLPTAAGDTSPALVLGLAGLGSYAARLMIAQRFETSQRDAWLHPFGVALLVAIQWYALARRLAGKPVAWKARVAGRARSFAAAPTADARAARAALDRIEP